MNGIINVYKEKGFTSFDVVAKLRGILHIKKIGHTGTLDPDAEGVLPVCVGNATKACEYLSDHDKEYVVSFVLGIQTDTQDISGTIINEVEADVDEARLTEVIKSYVKTYDQIPPMYSAKKVNGKKLYELARAGITVERKPSKVTIHSIEIMEIKLPRVVMKVHCSKGTYIRTLCDDIGMDLGCYATMETLLRTRVGEFDLEHAVKLSEIEALAKQGRVSYCMMDTRLIFDDLRQTQIDESESKALNNGNPLKLNNLDDKRNGEKICIYDADGIFKAIYEYKADAELCKPWKMFIS